MPRLKPIAVSITILVMIAAAIAGGLAALPAGEAQAFSGSGTDGNPYIVTNVSQLQEMNNDLTAYYRLANDIDASATSTWNLNGSYYEGFVPIGVNIGTSFTGGFDGGGYTISGLYINRSSTNNVGLFGHVGNQTATTLVENVNLNGTTIKGARGSGTLIGRVTGNANTLIINCSSANGSVTGDGATGGLIGSHNSWRETPGGTDNPVLRYSWANISVSYSGTGAGDKFGGLAGCSQKGTISNCYARGPVTHSGPGERIGGLAGCIDYRGELFDSYSTGLVTVAANCTKYGGLVGNRLGAGGNNGVVTNCFWDTQTSNQSSSAGGTGKTTADMKTESTFTNAGWNFTDIWDIDGVNDGYPFLVWTDVFTPTQLTIGGTFTANDKVYDGNNSATINDNNLTLVPDVGGANVSLADVAIVFNNASVGLNKTVYINIATLTGTDAGNYSLSLVGAPTATANISYTLTTSSTAGGDVTTPGEAGPYHYYNHSEAVELVATPDACYEFANWTGDTDTIADINASTTTITMNASYSIVANFAAGHGFTGGSGTIGDPWLITNVYDLQAMSCNLSAHYALANDIDATNTSTWNSGAGFLPIGNLSNKFTGSFNGSGYTITGLFINRSTTDYVGLFGYVNAGVSISNVSLAGVNSSGNNNVGVLVGYNYEGTILNSSVSGNVSGDDHVGGLIGQNWQGSISNSSASGNVSGTNYVGGLAGTNIRGNISGSSASVYVSGAYASAGLIGQNIQGNISDSHAAGNVDSSAHIVGGLIGYNEQGTVVNSTAAGYVNSSSSQVGGLIGDSRTGTVLNCSAAGTVSGSATAGGLVGYNEATSVSDSHATGNVSITGSTAGGLIGFNHDGSTVSNASATGNVSGTGTLGGLIGANEDSTVSDSLATGVVTGLNASIGGFIGQNVNGTVYNCSASGDVNTGDITLNSMAGGLAGSNDGAVANCSASGNVSATGDYVGGLIGENITGGSVSNSSATGSVSGYRYVGGLAGYSNGSVSDSYAAGVVNATDIDAGGLVGKNDPGSTMARCYATGNVSSAGGDGVGGLVGENFGPIFSSYAAGNASGISWVGGLVGVNSAGGNVSNAYATGNVSGSNHIGGLVGANWDASSSINISYSIGYVNGSSDAGGLVGTNNGIVSNSFYDTNTSNQSDTGKGLPKTTAEMKSFSTFFSASWDIEKNHIHNINDGYPYLSWQIPGNSPVWYIYDTSVTLNISSTGGGSVITPGEGEHSYNVGDVVSINASPDHCYLFVNWTGTGVDASKIDFPNSASANITMDNDYNVTANFAPDSAFAGGDGSAGNPYLIQNVCALQNMSSDLSAHYALANDIDASATSGWNWNVDHFEGFIPVGNGSGAFTGTFNGSGYTITGLFINRSVDNVGLFGYVNPEWAAVSNVSLVGMNVIGGDYVGGLAGTNYGSVFNCSAAGNVSGSQSVGGLMGYNMGTVSNSSAAANVRGTYVHTGGLVGWNDNSNGNGGGSIFNSSASGDVNGVDNVGGLAGTSNGIIDNSSSTASVDGDDDVGGLVGKNVTGGSVSNSSAAGAVSGHAFVGGLAGDNQANSSIYNSHAAGQVNGSSNGTGGFVGLNNGSVSTSYATGNVFGSSYTGGFAGYNDYGVINTSYAIGNASGASSVGGFVGLNKDGLVEYSYAAGNAYGSSNSVGGFVGTNYANVSNSYARGDTNGVQNIGGFAGTNSGLSAVITRSYSTGSASGTSNLGGLVGINGSDIVSDSFWDTETSGLGTSSGGTPKNTSEMKLFSTFYVAEWDLICESTNGDDDIWGLDYSGAGNNGYPFLWWQGLTHNVSFMLNMSSSDGGNVSTPGEGMQGPYNCSESVSIIADPDVGYFFVDWTGNTSTVDDVNAESTTVTMFGDYSIQANFTSVMYNLSIASTVGGNVTAPGEGTFPYGSGHIVAINASADPCYYFVNWTGDMGGNISDVNSPDTSITMNGNYSITANFAIYQYTLNTSSTAGGNVSPPGEGTYNCSETVNISATADDCYYFVNWTGTGVDASAVANPNASSTTINMSNNYSVQANFAMYQYTLNTSSTAGGNVSAPGESGPYTYNCSQTVTINASPDDCYHFVNWTGSGVDAGKVANTSAASTTINMSANYSIQANFAVNQITLTTSSTSGGSVTAPGESGPYTYNCSQIVTINATAAECYYFVEWTGTGVDAGAVANASSPSTAITMNASYAVTANFAVYEFDLTTSSSAGGNVSTPGEGTYTYNCSEVAYLIATPDDCYRFVEWTGSGVVANKVDDPLSASTFIIMDADYDVYANFEIITYTLTYTAGAGGTINGTTLQVVNCGANGSEVTAVPNTRYAFLIWSDSETNASRTDTNVAGNITVTANFRYLGGGGGGGYIPPYGTTTITLNLFDDSSTWAIDTNGVLQEDVDATSPDGKVSIHIPTGTKTLDEDGNPLTEINADPVDYCPGPPDGMTVIIAFDFHPDGATFDPAIEITITYDPDALPEDVDESQIVIAFYNEATGAWEYLSGTVDPDTNTITFSATHFSIFAVMAPGECAPAPTETPTPTPEPTVEPTPTATVAPTPTPTVAPPPAPAGGGSWPDRWVLIILVAAGGLLLAILIGAIVRRKRKQ